MAPRRLRPGVHGGPEPVPYVPGSSEWTSRSNDPEPQFDRQRVADYSRVGNPKEDAATARRFESYSEWQVRELLRQRQARTTARTLAYTAKRGGHAVDRNTMVGNRTPTSWFDDQNRLVAQRTAAMSPYSYVPGVRSANGDRVVGENRAYNRAANPEGILTMFQTPRRLSVNPRVR